jgi:hypothetical protein
MAALLGLDEEAWRLMLVAIELLKAAGYGLIRKLSFCVMRS